MLLYLLFCFLAAKCVDGDLRLVGGDTDNEGVLLVCFNQRWGTVNGDGWREADTQVTCRQLGINNTGISSCMESNRFNTLLFLRPFVEFSILPFVEQLQANVQQQLPLNLLLLPYTWTMLAVTELKID